MVTKVLSLPFDQCLDWLKIKHYAHRIPCIEYAFALYVDEKLEGIVTYGTPPSSPLREGICGKEKAGLVVELNRLVINEGCVLRNAASFLIGRSIRLLPKPKIIISFADLAQGHVGYVYQATNFIYTGLSAKRTDWRIKGEEHLHGISVADKCRGEPDRKKKLTEIYGDRLYLTPRSRKHRYLFFHGCSDEIIKSLRYRKEEYPKGNSRRYETQDIKEFQALLI